MCNAGVLIAAGYRVIEAATVDEGAVLFDARIDIDAVVRDVQTPGRKDGLELAQLVCQTRPGAGVVIVSDRIRPVRASFATGVQFLRRPYKPSDLLSLLRQAIEAARDTHGGLHRT